MDEESKELSFESTKEEKFAQIESTIAKAKGKVKSELRESFIFIILTGIGALFISFHYTNVLPLNTILLVVVWILSILFLLAFIGSDVAKAKSELEANEAIRNVMLKLPESTDSTTEYFDSLVKINGNCLLPKLLHNEVCAL